MSQVIKFVKLIALVFVLVVMSIYYRFFSSDEAGKNISLFTTNEALADAPHTDGGDAGDGGCGNGPADGAGDAAGDAGDGGSST